MKAIVQDTYGETDVLELKDIDRPEVGDDEVLIKVRAAGVDPGVWHLMTGQPYLQRVIGFGLRGPKTKVRGRDVAGTVEAVGRNVSRFRPGDEVFGTCEGSFAEYATAREDRLAPKPPNLTFDQAAGVPISAQTAFEAVREVGKVRPGQRVLVIGAAGGVGTYAVQLAKLFGAEVTGVCSTSKVDLVRSIGAHHVIDYTREDFLDGSQRYDLIVDIAGNRPLAQLRKALADKGTLVIVGGEGGGKWTGGLGRNVRASGLSPFVGQKLRWFVAKENTATLRHVAEYIEKGAVTPVIDRTYSLSEAPKAIKYVEEGNARGKVVISV